MEGKVWKFGDNIDTDLIIPAIYLTKSDPDYLASYCMSGINENFSKIISKGDIIVAGENFGCGSSREQAPLSIKSAGISCIIAKSFARIFFRNSINIGLPIIENKIIYDEVQEGDKLFIDFKEGKIKNITCKKTYKINPFPDFLQNIIKCGGLIEYTKMRLKK